jgi:hypothetical protein
MTQERIAVHDDQGGPSSLNFNACASVTDSLMRLALPPSQLAHPFNHIQRSIPIVQSYDNWHHT